MKEQQKKEVCVENIYKLDGRVPVAKAIPFGLQHILAMFVANLTPIILIAAASGVSEKQQALLLQNAMFMAGIATLIQLYPLGRVGARLPIVMGVSFTFVTLLSYIGTEYGYADSASPCERSGGFVADVQTFLSALFVSRTGRSCEQLRPWQSDSDLLIAGDCLVGTGYLRKGDHGQTSGKSGL